MKDCLNGLPIQLSVLRVKNEMLHLELITAGKYTFIALWKPSEVLPSLVWSSGDQYSISDT